MSHPSSWLKNKARKRLAWNIIRSKHIRHDNVAYKHDKNQKCTYLCWWWRMAYRNLFSASMGKLPLISKSLKSDTQHFFLEFYGQHWEETTQRPAIYSKFEQKSSWMRLVRIMNLIKWAKCTKDILSYSRQFYERVHYAWRSIYCSLPNSYLSLAWV
jgi:hypothetical protein